MSRAVRITVGSVLVGVLAFVALVAGIMSATSGWDGGDVLGDLADPAAGVDTPGTAEVLDVDDYGDGWPTVDVRFTTSDGEVVVTYVDWEWSEDLPAPGDDVEVMYDDLDPEYAFAADDPWLLDGSDEPQADGGEVTTADAGDEGAADEAAADQGGVPAEVAGWVALAALAGVVVGAVVTVVAVVRAPAPRRDSHVAGPYEAPHPHLVGGPPPQPYPGQPYPGRPYPAQAYPPQPVAPAAAEQTPSPVGPPPGGRWSSPG